MGKFYIYILKCNDETLYTGQTKDLEKRIELHQEGKASKYTRARLPITLVYKEEVETRSLAMQREYQIKKMTRIDKIKLISKNPY